MQKIVFVVAVAVLVHGLAAAVHVHGSGTSLNAITSCSQLPYPEACRSLSSIDPHFGPLKSKTTFRDFNLQGATTRAQQAQLASSKVDRASFDPRTRAAWSDCLALASDTVDLLHSSSASQSNDDSQTWLSAAATNIQACRDGFADLGLAPPTASAMPILSTNISQLLSNSLAINKESYAPLSTDRNRRLLSRGGYPEWVSPVDRRLLQTANPAASADLVVAKDGSGDYKSISEAVAASLSKRGAGSSKRFVIYVKRGVYAENVEIKKTIKNLMIIGDGIDATVVTGNKNVQDGSTTFRSATFAVVGDGFIARDITFENTAGPQKHQAVALRSGSDLSIFYRCSFKGYQDTLYVYSQRQFYRDCDVYGTVDFIFGNAAAVLQNCNIYVRRPMSNQKNTITAQGRTDSNQNTGISVHNSKIAAASDLRPVQGSFKTYLGRPWKQYSRTVFMKSNLDGLIAPAGWLEWSGNFALNTLYYGEYMNTGAGASTGARVSWKGFRVISNAAEAGKFTVGSFVAGNSWIPATGVPFTTGL